MSLSQSCVAKLYASVIEDVIGGVREFFMDESVDEQVLMELRHSWELKLKTTKAVEVPKPEQEPQPPHLKNTSQQQKAAGLAANSQSASGVINSSSQSSKALIQLTFPGLNAEGNKYSIDMPNSALADNQLHNILSSGPVLSATMALPAELATALLHQQQVNAAFPGHTSSIPIQTAQTLQAVQAVQNRVQNGIQTDAKRQTFTQQGGVPQVDGVRDSSDEDDNEDEDNDDEDDNEDDDKDEDDDPDAADQHAIEEEPLNSEDDVSEDDPIEMFQTENVVVCQYDKITRSRNKWKFYLKDGIMHLDGKDFVFQKSSGDAEW